MRARYVVDERVGCVAVVDTAHPYYGDREGIGPDYPGVVRYWMGRQYKRRPATHRIWYVPRFAVQAAERLAARLNSPARDPDTGGRNG